MSSIVAHDQQPFISYLDFFLGLVTNQNYTAEKLTFKGGTNSPYEHITAEASVCVHN